MARRASRTARALVVSVALVLAVAVAAVLALRLLQPAGIDPAKAAVDVTADGCPGVDAHGAGAVVAAGRVLTAAHVVAGSTTVEVRQGERTTTGTVIALDPVNDLAVLAIGPGFGRPLPIGTAGTGDRGLVTVTRRGVQATMPIVVRRPITLQTEDIYLDEVHDRDALELDADIEPGDSGAGVVVAGHVVGVVVARDRQAAHRAYAVDPAPMTPMLARSSSVPTGACARVG